MKKSDNELTDAQLDAIADQGEQLLEWQKARPRHGKLPGIRSMLLVIAGIVLFLCFFFWWQENSFEVLQHAELMWGWTSR